MNTEEKVQILSEITTRDSAGKHFTEKFSSDDLTALETEGLLTIDRPVHEATGLPYSEEYYRVEITAEGQELVDANPEYCVE